MLKTLYFATLVGILSTYGTNAICFGTEGPAISQCVIDADLPDITSDTQGYFDYMCGDTLQTLVSCITTAAGDCFDSVSQYADADSTSQKFKCMCEKKSIFIENIACYTTGIQLSVTCLVDLMSSLPSSLPAYVQGTSFNDMDWTTFCTWYKSVLDCYTTSIQGSCDNSVAQAFQEVNNAGLHSKCKAALNIQSTCGSESCMPVLIIIAAMLFVAMTKLGLEI